jgi:carbon-monoxide dehydrogenase medium subunit
MKLRLSEPSVLIDVARIPGLSGIREKDGKIEIGAATTHRDVAASDLLKRVCPVMADTAVEIGDPQVRNRGTLGGSLAHADPAADYPAAMLAVDAEVHLKGPGGWRKIKASDFFQGLFTVDLAPDEIIAGVQFAPIKAAAYAKLHQRASHFAIVGVAAAVDVKGGVFQSTRVGLTGASTHAMRLTDVERALAGKPATKETIAAAAAASEFRHPRQRGISPRNDQGLRAARARGRAGAGVAVVGSFIQPDDDHSPIVERGLQSRYVTLHGLVQHHVYRAGQVSLLKRASREGGVSPPRQAVTARRSGMPTGAARRTCR